MNESIEKQITVNDYLRILYHGRWVIIISFITVFGFVTYYTYTATPIYRATAKVMFKENKAAEKTLLNLSNFAENEKMINNQVEILCSRTLAEKVIKKLQRSDQAEKLRILGNVLKLQKNKFNISKSIKKLFAGIGNKKDSDHDKTQQIHPGKQFNSYVQSLLNSISVDPVRNTDIVELSVTATSPFEAAYITNTLAQVYKQENQLESQAEVRKVKDFLAEQLNLIQNQLRASEQELKEYKEKEKVVALPEETQELVTKTAEFETLYREALLELESTRKRLDYVNEQLDKSRLNFQTDAILANPFIEEIKKQMAEIETKKAKFIAQLINNGVYDENNQEIKALNEKINSLSEKLKSRVAKLAASEVGDPITFSESLFTRKVELEVNVQSLLPRINAVKKIVNEYNKQLESIPAKGLKLARLERASKLDEKITLMMKEKYEESRITEVGQLGNVKIIDPAIEPLSPIKPKKKMNLMLGIILGLGLGIGITLLMEYFDNSVRSIDDIEQMKIPTLGSIPLIKIEEAVGKFGRKSKSRYTINNKYSDSFKSRLITHLAPKSPVSEAYRSLRTSIQFSRADTSLKTILVTSPGPQEGKSTTIANLAITMAQMGSKVLLVDTDLRRPILHSIFGVSRTTGISNYLIGKIDLDEAIFETEIDNLYLMPSGTLPPNPSELLASTAMKECIEALKERFDVILFDSPPVIAVTDAVVLGSKVDGVIVVVKSGQTDRYATERSFNILKNVCEKNILGTLLNIVNVEGAYGSYYYYYYHYYYGKQDNKKKKSLRL